MHADGAQHENAPQQQQYAVRQIMGTVSVVNDRGFQLDGQDAYVDFGSYYAGPRPVVGDDVIGSAKGRYLKTLKIKGDPPRPAVVPPTPAAPAATPTSASSRQDVRVAVRLELMSAAARYAALRAEMTPDDVIATAILWQTWVEEAAD